jgi:very-short-patch-repair endonuclease
MGLKGVVVKILNTKEKIKRKARLARFSIELNQSLPKSEVWFWKVYKQHQDKHDLKNGYWGPFIYDILNHKHKYAVEIDGSYHDSPVQKLRDEQKNEFARKQNYLLLRVKAYDLADAKSAIEFLLKYRNK